MPMVGSQLSEPTVATTFPYCFQYLVRRPVLIGALAVGLLIAVSIDLGVRRWCNPMATFFSYKPSAAVVDRIRITDWDRPLNGFAARSWGWVDLDLWSAAQESGSALWQAKDGEAVADSPSKRIARKYRASSLIDVIPIDEYYGATVKIRATQFGFPFRSSIRESVSGVLRRDRDGRAEYSIEKPAALAVCVQSGWAWAAQPSESDRLQAAGDSVSRREWVLPLGLMGNVIVYAVVVLLVCSVPLYVRSARRLRKSRCVYCGYSLLGIGGTKCPECGASVSERGGRPLD